MTEFTETSWRALAAGYRVMYLEAVSGLLRIRDEANTKDECIEVAKETLDEVGES